MDGGTSFVRIVPDESVATTDAMADATTPNQAHSLSNEVQNERTAPKTSANHSSIVNEPEQPK